MKERWVWSLGLEDPLEKEMATHSSIRAWEIPWTEEPGKLQSMGLQELDMAKWLNHHHYHVYEPWVRMWVPWYHMEHMPGATWWSKFTPSMTVNPNHLCGWWSDVLSRLLRNAKSIRSSMFTIWISVFRIQQHAPYVLKHMWLEKEVAAIQFCFIVDKEVEKVGSHMHILTHTHTHTHTLSES